MQMKNRNKYVKGILQGLCGLVLVSTATGVKAACSWAGSGSAPGTMTKDFGDIVISPTAVAGDVIASVTYSTSDVRSAVGTGGTFLNCNNGTTILWGNSSFGTTTYNGIEYIDSGIEGLAFRVSPTGNSSYFKEPFASFSFPPNYSALIVSSATAFQYNYIRNVQVDLIKTADTIGSGTVPAGTLFNVQDGSGFDIFYYNISAFNVISGACEVSDYPTEVSLGSAYSQRFRNPGDTQNETEFSISLTCNSSTLSPTMTFEGATDSIYPTVFSNPSGDSYAENVGVQLLSNGSVITPGASVSLGQVGTTSVMPYGFSARLFRTGNAITAGSVDVPVTFTISYE